MVARIRKALTRGINEFARLDIICHAANEANEARTLDFYLMLNRTIGGRTLILCVH